MQGRDTSASEAMRDAPRVLEALRADIQKGADSGPAVAADAVFAAVRKSIGLVTTVKR